MISNDVKSSPFCQRDFPRVNTGVFPGTQYWAATEAKEAQLEVPSEWTITINLHADLA
jgi:hypothetical protein